MRSSGASLAPAAAAFNEAKFPFHSAGCVVTDAELLAAVWRSSGECIADAGGFWADPYADFDGGKDDFFTTSGIPNERSVPLTVDSMPAQQLDPPKTDATVTFWDVVLASMSDSLMKPQGCALCRGGEDVQFQGRTAENREPVKGVTGSAGIWGGVHPGAGGTVTAVSIQGRTPEQGRTLASSAVLGPTCGEVTNDTVSMSIAREGSVSRQIPVCNIYFTEDEGQKATKQQAMEKSEK